MKRLGILIASVVVAALVIALGRHAWASRPGGNGVVARLQDADGSTYIVTQTWNDWSEPYTVSFFVRGPDQRWGWCYIDHQSARWTNAEILSDGGGVVRILERGKLRAEYRRNSSKFSLHHPDVRLIRTLDAPQAWQSPPY